MYATVAVPVSSALSQALGDGPRVHFAPGTENPYDGQGDGDVIQGITCDVGFHLVHDVGVEALSVVQLEGLDDPSIHGWSCDVVLAVKGDLCGLPTLDLSIVDPVHRRVVHDSSTFLP